MLFATTFLPSSVPLDFFTCIDSTSPLAPRSPAQLKKILNVWGEYLSSPASASVLNTSSTGWFGPTGIASLEKVGNLNGVTNFKFDDMYKIPDPSAEHKGFKSWDAFFTRPAQDKFRPIIEPENDDVLATACESKVYKVATDVHERDQFWVKGQPYSVQDMLAFDPFASQFVGGTIYQAFLSALSYHRWHSPVSGTVKKAYVVDGTYYSEPLYDGFNARGEMGADPSGENTSQEYIAATATRAIIFIEADNPKIGLIAFIGVGMTEVSTCDITVKEGQHVKKGDQTGYVHFRSTLTSTQNLQAVILGEFIRTDMRRMFHFGGSSHCVLFRKGVKVSGFPEESDHNVPVRSKLCVVE